MGASSCLSKCIIVTINLFFWVGAALMITSGVLYLTHGDGVNSDVNSKPAYVAIAIGSLLFLVGLAGICGACSENKVLLGMFIFVAIGSLVLLVYSAISLFTGRDDAIDETEKYVTDQFNKYGDNLTVSSFLPSITFSKNGSTTAPTPTTASATTPASSSDSNDFIDTIQSTFHCCGWTNYTDWNSYENWNKSNIGFVPTSCCDETAANAQNVSCPKRISMDQQSSLIYSKGCKDDIDILVKFVFNLMSGAAITFAILVFLALCGTIYLIHRKRRSSQGFDYSSIVA